MKLNLQHLSLYLALFLLLAITGKAQTANLTVTKTFNPGAVVTGQVTRMEIKIENIGAGTATNVAIDDVMPTDMFIPNPENLFQDTGGTVSFGNMPSSGEVHMTGGTIPGFSFRVILIDVYVTTTGSYFNQTSNVTWEELGTPFVGPNGAANLSVVPSAPTASKSFAPTLVTVGGMTTLTIGITNTSASTITNVAFSDNFPADMAVSAPLTLTNTCGGTIRNLANTGAVVAGDLGLQLVGGTISGAASCAVTIKVTLAVVKVYNNTTSAITLDGGGTPGVSAAAIVTASNLPPPAPNVALIKACTSPANCTTAAQAPGIDVTYSIAFSNSGGANATNTIIVDAIPVNLDYKLGSATSSPGTTGITFIIEYSSDLSTWAYTPVSGGGGAAAGYDRNVKAVRWRTASNLLFTAPNNSGSVSFVARVQ